MAGWYNSRTGNELPALHINHIGTFSNFEGVRQGFETNAASRPWMQLDMGKEVTVRKVGVTLIVRGHPYIT